MPEICAFYGIVIKMFFDDHLPAHIHAAYGEEEVVFNIDTLTVIGGRLPGRAMALVREWASLHRDELKQSWDKIQKFRRPAKIDPLP